MLTTDQLRAAMLSSVGDDESINLNGDYPARDFTELGFDSLALMETCAHLKREYGIIIPDEKLWDLTTPGQLLEWVNGAHS